VATKIIDSYNHLGWKRPLRSSSPTTKWWGERKINKTRKEWCFLKVILKRWICFLLRLNIICNRKRCLCTSFENGIYRRPSFM